MDVQMPDMDGIEATRVIRDRSSSVPRHDIPIIAMTAYAMKGDREKFLEAGMNDYVSKPVNLEDLEKVLSRWLGSGASPPEHARLDRGPDKVSASAFRRDKLLTMLGNDERLFTDIVGMFLDDLPRHVRALEDGLTNRDRIALQRISHTLRGSAGTVCAEGLQEVARQIETASEKGNLEHIEELVETMKREVSSFREVASPSYLIE
jgi:HPt (histidine-containing phosphotransfer) domain-containing protein